MCKIFLEWSVNIVPPNNKLYLCFRTVSKPWEQNIDRRFDFCLLERLMTSLCWLPFDTTDNSDQKKPICAKTWIYGELQALRCHPTIVPHHYQFSYCMRVCCLPRQSSSVTTLGSSLSALVIQYFLANSSLSHIEKGNLLPQSQLSSSLSFAFSAYCIQALLFILKQANLIKALFILQ